MPLDVFSINSRTRFDREEFTRIYLRGSWKTSMVDQEVVAGMLASLARRVIYRKWPSLPATYKEDVLIVGVVSAFEHMKKGHLNPELSVQAFLLEDMRRCMGRWLRAQFDHINTLELMPGDSTFEGPQPVDSGAALLSAITDWIARMSNESSKFRLLGRVYDAAEFTLKFRIFFGYFPIPELLWLNWGDDLDAEWVLDYVEVRWSIARLRLLDRHLWIPEFWREALVTTRRI